MLRRHVAVAAVLGTVAAATTIAAAPAPAGGPSPPLFATSDKCLACHNGMTTPAGEDVSIGFAWRGSMMANAARDPYWQAAVRREAVDYPAAAAVIQNECAACHMPMARFEANLAGRQLEVFSRLGGGPRGGGGDPLALDGVSCALCHQLQNAGPGLEQDGNFKIDTARPPGDTRSAPGPSGRLRRQRSDTASAPWPQGGTHTYVRAPGSPPGAHTHQQTDSDVEASARSCSRPSSVILSGPHGGIQTQLIRSSLTMPSVADFAWSSMTSVSGQAAEVRVMSMVAMLASSMWMP